MAKITLKGHEIHTLGELPARGTKATSFTLVAKDLSEHSLEEYAGKRKVLNIYPSVDTSVCSISVKSFFQKLSDKDDVILLNISKDLPFALSRFAEAEKLPNSIMLSDFRGQFSKEYQLEMIDGALKGLCSRAVIVLDGDSIVLYTEQVPEITQEPNYEAVLKALG